MVGHLLTEGHCIDRFEEDPSGCYPEPLRDMYWIFCECGEYFILDFRDVPINPWDIKLSEKEFLKLNRILSESPSPEKVFQAICGVRARFDRVLGVALS